MARQAVLEVVAQLEDVLDLQRIDVVRAGGRLQFLAQFGDALAVRLLVGLGAEVEEEGVGQDLDDVHLAEQAQRHVVTRQGLVPGDRETRHQAGGLVAALRVDLVQEAQLGGLVALAEDDTGRAFLRRDQGTDQEGFAGLAGAEDADRHGPRGGQRQLARLDRVFLEGPLQALQAGDPLAVVVEPLQGLDRSLRHAAAALGQLLVLVANHRSVPLLGGRLP